ncbi:hypothetical protein EUGRSUZ_A02566 [Eucalyptus grandis]|uniref:Uncharacterized protein n=2 Tax=Eucalyptus grandis TaxID=71139 RepID=A0ACC3M6G2_EUCGR|nr:hypothetical protein EUGRSUZ_A02566 [Eucalyptus grandis]
MHSKSSSPDFTDTRCALFLPLKTEGLTTASLEKALGAAADFSLRPHERSRAFLWPWFGGRDSSCGSCVCRVGVDGCLSLTKRARACVARSGGCRAPADHPKFNAMQVEGVKIEAERRAFSASSFREICLHGFFVGTYRRVAMLSI